MNKQRLKPLRPTLKHKHKQEQEHRHKHNHEQEHRHGIHMRINRLLRIGRSSLRFTRKWKLASLRVELVRARNIQYQRQCKSKTKRIFTGF